MAVGAPETPLLSSLAHADVAQLVEHNLAKVGVAGSNPVVRSRTRRSRAPSREPVARSERPATELSKVCSALVDRIPTPRIGDAVPANPLNTDDFGGELYNLGMSEAARPLLDQVKAFIADEVEPITEEFFRLGEEPGRPLELRPGPARAARRRRRRRPRPTASGTSSSPTPRPARASATSTTPTSPVELGKNPLASECLNCSAPDTGNMEVLERVGTPEQKKQWLEPLLNGEIRSLLRDDRARTWPAPTPATSPRQAVLDGDEWVINGEKYYISGAGDPRCKIMICMVRTNPDAAAHLQQSQILVPMDTPGVEILGPMHVFGDDDAPHGHMHLRLTDVRVPKDNILLGEGRGFEISQLRLGPGRIHHCMRSIGAAERALELMVERGLSREAFGKPLISLGKNTEVVAKARIEIEAMRLMVLQGGQGHGPHGQRRGPRVGERREGDGARAGVRDHRPGHPDPRRHRRVAVDAAGRHVHGPAHAAPRRRARRGALHGRRPGGDRPLPADLSERGTSMKQLSGLDASFLYMETGSQFGHVSSLSIYERPDDPDYEPLVVVAAPDRAAPAPPRAAAPPPA